MVSHERVSCTAGALSLLLACSAPADPNSSRDIGSEATSNEPGGSSSPNSPEAGNGQTGGSNPGSIENRPTPGLAGAGGVPCDVATIISEHCTTCHAAMPRFNAPMSLMSAADFSATAPISSSESVRTAAARRIDAEGAARMPPPGTVEALSDSERATLTAWLAGGAQAVEGGCAIGEGSPIGNGSDDLLPRPTDPGAVLGPYDGWDDGVECYPFVTYEASSREQPFRVGTAVDRYLGFGFSPPWQGTRYIRAIKAIIDNAQVLHHWILFEEPSAVDGQVEEIVGAHPAGQMLHGWAPGGTDLYLTPDVGLRMDGSSTYLLEVHYNSNDPNAVDASGLEICVTETVPENEAVISWLGTDFINGTSATGTCAPRSTEPIHIIAGTPHMHLKGTNMRVTVNRAGAGSEVVHDEPFSFENQRGYPQDIRIEPGDSLTTTCTYNAPSSFGQGTNDEMCYWFALAYPAGALSDGGLFGTFVHGENACLGL